MAKKRNWALIIISVGAFLIIVVGGGLAVVGYYVAQQFSLQQETGMSPEDGAKAMDQARAKFKGQTPFVEIGADGEAIVHREQEGQTRQRLTALQIVGFEGRGRQGVFRLKMPFWVVTMGSRRNLRVSRPDGREIELHITAEDLERRGPGLILDRTDERGRQIIVWTE
jgi:hypothetical protein